MAHYINKDDIVDDLIKPAMILDSDLVAVDDALDDVCRDNDTDPATIDKANLPYKLKRLGIALLCVEVCKRKTGADPRADAAGDAFARKHKIFQTEANRFMAQIDTYILGGGERYGGAAGGGITLGRA